MRECPRCGEGMSEVAGDLVCIPPEDGGEGCGYDLDTAMDAWDACEAEYDEAYRLASQAAVEWNRRARACA